MKGIREVKQRIKSVKNTGQITRAMQLVASSKMKRAQDSAQHGRSYAILLAEILASLVGKEGGEISHPLVTKREVKTRGVLVIATDKGLCGPLNSNLFRLMADEITGPAKYVVIGRKAAQYVTRTGRDLMADFAVSDRANFSEVRPVAQFLLDAYMEGEVDTIDVFYPRFINTLSQEPAWINLVPLYDLQEELERMRQNLSIEADAGNEDEREFIVEPSAQALLAELPAMFVRQSIYHRVLEAKASEHSARMVAMKSATDNAANLVDELTLEYNKARQAAITQEILEIAAATQFN